MAQREYIKRQFVFTINVSVQGRQINLFHGFTIVLFRNLNRTFKEATQYICHGNRYAPTSVRIWLVTYPGYVTVLITLHLFLSTRTIYKAELLLWARVGGCFKI